MMTVEDRLGKARNRIKLIGIELEGGWSKMPPGCDGPIRDGSVVFTPPAVPPNINALLQSYMNPELQAGKRLYAEWKAKNPFPDLIGELPSPPMPKKEIALWVTKFYPQFVNDTCGLHIHMSFNTKLTYQRLMDKGEDGTSKYEKALITLLEKWGKEESLPSDHPFWSRLTGKSKYCKVGNKYIDEQARIAKKNFNHNDRINRYTFVNYSFSTHGTVEIRGLPMFKEVEQSQRAIDRVLDITNAFILTQIKREEATKLSVDEDLEPATMVIREDI